MLPETLGMNVEMENMERVNGLNESIKWILKFPEKSTGKKQEVLS